MFKQKNNEMSSCLWCYQNYDELENVWMCEIEFFFCGVFCGIIKMLEIKAAFFFFFFENWFQSVAADWKVSDLLGLANLGLLLSLSWLSFWSP